MPANEDKNEQNSPTPVATDLVGKRVFGLRVAHGRHTGRRISVHHTSYALLFFLLAMTGLTLMFANILVEAGSYQAEQGNITLSGKVSGPPPTKPAVITFPKDGTRFTDSTIAISGTCEQDTLIEIYRLGSFAGSDTCSSNGQFELAITLVGGKNDLLARTKDGLGQYAPNSGTVIVHYDLPEDKPKIRSPGNPAAPQPLLLTTKSLFSGINKNQALTLRYEIDGGVIPYAVSVAWGDGSENDLYSIEKAGDYNVEHKYKEPGQYTVIISAKDSAGHESTIQTIVVVNQSTLVSGGITGNAGQDCSTTQCYISEHLVKLVNIMWVPFSVASLMTISFWLGEKIVLARIHLRLPKP